MANVHFQFQESFILLPLLIDHSHHFARLILDVLEELGGGEFLHILDIQLILGQKEQIKLFQAIQVRKVIPLLLILVFGLFLRQLQVDKLLILLRSLQKTREVLLRIVVLVFHSVQLRDFPIFFRFVSLVN